MVESALLPGSVDDRLRTDLTSDKSKGAFTDHLANERTFLAWIRTSLGIFALGCAIARFGGSSNTHTVSNHILHENKSMICGLILIACGIIILFYSIYRYHQINREILQKDLIKMAQIRGPITATLLLLLTMIVVLVIFVIM